MRVRFAPSPTGELHIGSVRTILYNYLFARQRGGRLILRVEDTDQERLVPGAIDSIHDGLHWLGIRWDEGPREGGPHAPYVQSERLALYREHADALVAKDAAYPCFCTKERLDEMRREQQARGDPITRYDRRCRVIPPADARARVETGEPHTIRLKVPLEGTVGVPDLVHGNVSWDLKDVEDQILLKSDGFPTYHMAVVVDDRAMEVSHVLRGDEWLASLPKHLVIMRAFGWEPPVFAHLPQVLGPDRKKLSKRHGAAAVREFREQGYLPEGIVNYLALLGWAPGTEEEVFRLDDLVARWSLERVQDSPAIWDRDRLNYFDGVHIRRLVPDDLAGRLRPFLPADASETVVREAVPLVRERISTLAEGRDMLAFLFADELDYPADLLVAKKRSAGETREALERVAGRLAAVPEFTKDAVEPALRGLGEELGWKATELFMAVRVAATGRTIGGPIIESLVLLGRERTLARLRDAVERLRPKAA